MNSASNFWDKMSTAIKSKRGYLSKNIAGIKKQDYLNAVRRWGSYNKGVMVKTDCFEEYLLTDSFLPECARNYNEIIACDISYPVISSAKKNLDNDNCEWLCADAADLPIKHGSCDLVVSPGTCSYLKTPLSGLKEAYRILKPEGTLIISILNKENVGFFPAKFLNLHPISSGKGYTREDFARLLSDSGFEAVESDFILVVPPLLNNLLLLLERSKLIFNNQLEELTGKVCRQLSRSNKFKRYFSWLIIFKAIKQREKA